MLEVDGSMFIFCGREHPRSSVMVTQLWSVRLIARGLETVEI
jgi:hypothetical protein